MNRLLTIMLTALIAANVGFMVGRLHTAAANAAQQRARMTMGMAADIHSMRFNIYKLCHASYPDTFTFNCKK